MEGMTCLNGEGMLLDEKGERGEERPILLQPFMMAHCHCLQVIRRMLPLLLLLS